MFRITHWFRALGTNICCIISRHTWCGPGLLLAITWMDCLCPLFSSPLYCICLSIFCIICGFFFFFLVSFQGKWHFLADSHLPSCEAGWWHCMSGYVCMPVSFLCCFMTFLYCCHFASKNFTQSPDIFLYLGLVCLSRYWATLDLLKFLKFGSCLLEILRRLCFCRQPSE